MSRGLNQRAAGQGRKKLPGRVRKGKETQKAQRGGKGTAGQHDT